MSDNEDGANSNRVAAAGGVGGAIVVILVWVLELMGVIIPADVASAMTVVSVAICAWIAARFFKLPP